MQRALARGCAGAACMASGSQWLRPNETVCRSVFAPHPELRHLAAPRCISLHLAYLRLPDPASAPLAASRQLTHHVVAHLSLPPPPPLEPDSRPR